MNTDKTMIIISAVIIGVAIGAAAMFFLGVPTASIPGEEPMPEEQVRGCTKELKICPDGTGVGRSGPNCEFAECSAVNNTDEDATTTPDADTDEQVVCTMEAKLCPDGVTAVGRTGPNCEFEACPDPVVCTQDVKECSDGSFVSRTAPDCEFAACPVVCTKDVKECPDGTYVSREAPECDFAACPAPKTPQNILITP